MSFSQSLNTLDHFKDVHFKSITKPSVIISDDFRNQDSAFRIVVIRCLKIKRLHCTLNTAWIQHIFTIRQ